MLERVGVPLEVHATNIDEREQPNEAPAAYVARIARTKAMSLVARRERTGEYWVLAADTTVTLDGVILGKAETPEEAAKMLRWLSGKTHEVLTAFVLIGEREERTVMREGLVSTGVTMIELDAAMIADYVASGEWRDKAGAYAVQGIAASFVKEVHGSVTNVVGLPLAEVLAALREVGGPQPKLAAGKPA